VQKLFPTFSEQSLRWAGGNRRQLRGALRCSTGLGAPELPQAVANGPGSANTAPWGEQCWLARSVGLGWIQIFALCWLPAGFDFETGVGPDAKATLQRPQRPASAKISSTRPSEQDFQYKARAHIGQQQQA